MSYVFNGSSGFGPGQTAAQLLSQMDNARQSVELPARDLTHAAPPVLAADFGDRRVRVRKILKLRSKRQSIFGAKLFAEPAWDILLQLYESHLSERRESVSAISCASQVPLTTALRWLNLLERGDWIVRRADPLDGRRVFVSISPKGAIAMDRFFAQPEIAAPL